MSDSNACGKLVATALDDIAQDDPQRTFAEFLQPPHLDQDVLVLTFADFANAVDRLAWWLKDKYTELGFRPFDTVAYVGLPDIRYYLMLFAASKAQVVLLFSAPVNDIAGHRSLMQQTNSKALFYTQETAPQDLIKACHDLPCVSIPDTKTILETTKVKSFLYEKSYEKAGKDLAVYFHTSGTTGSPKAIPWTNEVLVGASFSTHLADLDGRPVHPRFQRNPPGQPRRRLLSSLSAFHASMGLLIAQVLYADTTYILTPMHLPHPEYTADAMTRWIQQSKCESLVTFPSRLEPALSNDAYMAELKQLKYIFTGGAALSDNFASQLADDVCLAPVYVATELPFLQLHAADLDAWEYVCLDSKALGIEWRPFADDKYEMVYMRDDSLTLPPQVIFQIFPNKEEHRMGDLFSPHPTKPHHWRFAGRVDDIIILSIAQNVNPIPFEQRVGSHERVKAVAMLGSGRPTPCLVLELHDTSDAEAALDEIWPTMEKAWEGALTYNRVDRSQVIIAKPGKPIPKNAKGGIKRKDLQALYEQEIQAVY